METPLTYAPEQLSDAVSRTVSGEVLNDPDVPYISDWPTIAVSIVSETGLNFRLANALANLIKKKRKDPEFVTRRGRISYCESTGRVVDGPKGPTHIFKLHPTVLKYRREFGADYVTALETVARLLGDAPQQTSDNDYPF